MRLNARPDGGRREFFHRSFSEFKPNHRRRLDDRPLIVAEEVEACREEGLNGRWDGHLREIHSWLPAISHHAHAARVDEH